jgi:hypothetical protein
MLNVTNSGAKVQLFVKQNKSKGLFIHFRGQADPAHIE